MWSLQPWSSSSQSANENATFPGTQMQINLPQFSGATPIQTDVEMNNFPMIGSGMGNQNSGSVTTMAPWSQIPPAVIPWAMQNRPNVVRFGDEFGDYWITKDKYFKRKSDDLDLELSPSKMLMTEEKMTAQLNNMHISNNYYGQRYGTRGGTRHRRLPTLILSKEVKNLPSFEKSTLPKEMVDLLQNTTQTTQALVLYKPIRNLPTQFISKPPEDSSLEVMTKPPGTLSLQFIPKPNVISEENGNDNNNTSTSDLNMIKPTGFAPSSMDMEM